MNRKIKSRYYVLSIIFILLVSSINVTAIAFQKKNKPLNQSIFFNDTAETSFSDSVDLLIISPRRFSTYLLPLAKHKNETGIKTTIVNIEQILHQESNKCKDAAEKLKYYIKEAKDQSNVRYVLLVGGRKNQAKNEEWWIPVRYSRLQRNYGHWEENKFLTDLYFADLYDENGTFSSWDTDDDGIFGEWAKNNSAEDIPDLYPDIAVGRLPCRTIYDVLIAVNKIIDYETTDFSKDWFNNMVVVAGDTYPVKTPGFIDGEVHTQKALDYMDGFKPVKKWVSDKSLINWLDVVSAINNGCGFVFFSGHGGPHLWATYPVETADNWAASFHLRHMPFLINKDKLPICVSASGCFNNMINVSLSHSEWVYMHPFGIPLAYNVPRCWGESLMLKPFGGCISVIASTAFSYESSDITGNKGGCEWLDIHFFEQYNVYDTAVLGDCWSQTVSAFLQNFTIDWSDASDTGDALMVKNLQQWLLLGDPSLRIGG